MSSILNQDNELAKFFTDVEHLRDAFKNSIAAPELLKRILIIYGVGGVGKSSLLRMFRLHCKTVNVPVAIASGDEAKSVLDVLVRWTDDLKLDGVSFPAFSQTLEHHRSIQAKVENESAKIAERLTKGAAKTVVETAASTIPGMGLLIGNLGGKGAEALVDWLRGFLTKPDIDLLLDPTKRLADDFVIDVARGANQRRIVLMLDTYEQMIALDDWTCKFAQRLGQISDTTCGVLFVIAGRDMVNWDRQWSGWLAQVDVHPLESIDVIAI